jgi:site-specific recombinase XerD
MSLLKAGTDTSVIALWLGHEDPETTQVYLHGYGPYFVTVTSPPRSRIPDNL